MEQRFNISGTHEELQLILEREFNLTNEAAHIATAVFVYAQNLEQSQVQLKEDTLWFLDSGQADYQSHIFLTRYTISFTKSMLDVLDELLVPIVLALCGAGEFVALSELLFCIKALIKNLRRIKDNECCVYFHALYYLKTHSNRWFSAEQIMPHIDEEATCVNLDKNWKCKFRCGEHSKKCKIHLHDVKDILDTFCIDNVMEMSEDGTLYKFKI